MPSKSRSDDAIDWATDPTGNFWPGQRGASVGFRMMSPMFVIPPLTGMIGPESPRSLNAPSWAVTVYLMAPSRHPGMSGMVNSPFPGHQGYYFHCCLRPRG